MILPQNPLYLGLYNPRYVGVELVILSQHVNLPLKLLPSILPLQILIPLIQMQILLMLVTGNSLLPIAWFLQFHNRVYIADVGF